MQMQLLQSDFVQKVSYSITLLPPQVSFTGLRKLCVLARVWNVINISGNKDPGEFLPRAKILIL